MRYYLTFLLYCFLTNICHSQFKDIKEFYLGNGTLSNYTNLFDNKNPNSLIFKNNDDYNGNAKSIEIERFELREKFGEKSYFPIDKLSYLFNNQNLITEKKIECLDKRDWHEISITCNNISENFNYTLDGLISSIFIRDGNWQHKVNLSYSDKKIIREEYERPNEYGFYYIDYTYNEKSQLEQIQGFTPKNELMYILKYTYNSKGLISNISRYNTNAKREFSQNYTYDLKNNLIKYEDDNNFTKHTEKYQYNDSSLLTSIYSESITGSSKSSSSYYFNYTYNNSGKVSKIVKTVYGSSSRVLDTYIIEFMSYDKDGNWTEKIYKYNIKNENEYSAIKTTRKINYNEVSNNINEISETNKVYKSEEVEIQPSYSGGFREFYNFISNNFRLPNSPGLNGTILVSFAIDIDGKLVDIKILNDIGYGTGEEVKRVLNQSPKWVPAQKDGQKVKCYYQIPIKIQVPVNYKEE